MNNWYRVIQINKITFKTGLDIQNCYIIYKYGDAMKQGYLKLIFKNGQSNIGIWGTITLDLKGLVYFLQKKRCINSEIYVNQILKELSLLFYNCYIKERSPIIWIDNTAGYYILKAITKFYCKIGFLHNDWPAQLPDLNSIKNFWQIIKLKIGT